MGYTTEFTGTVRISPPLNAAEIAFLRAFADSRRMQRPEGPYSTRDVDEVALGFQGYNHPPAGQPSLWCNWVPTGDGSGIRWNGAEGFYDAADWMQYLVNHFLRPAGAARGLPGFEAFTFDHVADGVLDAQGDDPDDRWQLTVVGNVATGRGIRGY